MITRALNLYYTIFLEDIRYMIILTRQEREKTCIRTWQYGKTYREISKVARTAAWDIEIILNKIIEEMAEESKEDKI